MLLTNLADVARKAGLKVVEVDGWRSRGHGQLVAVKTVVCHHTAGRSAAADPSDFPSLRIVRDGRPGLSGPLSNLGLGRSGTVYVVAAGYAYHAGAVLDESMDNEHSIGIEAENDGVGEPWPTAQRTAYVLLCAALVRAYGLTPARVLAHREVCRPKGRKIDPAGIEMDGFRQAVARSVDDLERASRDLPRQPPPKPKVTLSRYLKRGNHGEDVKAVQRVVGARVDGDFGPKTEGAVKTWQSKRGLTSDGIVGPKTAARMGFGFKG